MMCLAAVELYLIEKDSLGVKTLDPIEKCYRPNYDEDEKSENEHVRKIYMH